MQSHLIIFLPGGVVTYSLLAMVSKLLLVKGASVFLGAFFIINSMISF